MSFFHFLKFVMNFLKRCCLNMSQLSKHGSTWPNKWFCQMLSSYRSMHSSEKPFVLFIQYLSLARPLRSLTYSTLKFMRSTCGKSKLGTIEFNTPVLVKTRILKFYQPHMAGETKAENIYHCPNICESCGQFIRTNLFKN